MTLRRETGKDSVKIRAFRVEGPNTDVPSISAGSLAMSLPLHHHVVYTALRVAVLEH